MGVVYEAIDVEHGLRVALKTLRHMTAESLADAESRGDLYTSVQLRCGSLAVVWLADDKPGTPRDVAVGASPDGRHGRALGPTQRSFL